MGNWKKNRTKLNVTTSVTRNDITVIKQVFDILYKIFGAFLNYKSFSKEIVVFYLNINLQYNNTELTNNNNNKRILWNSLIKKIERMFTTFHCHLKPPYYDETQ